MTIIKDALAGLVHNRMQLLPGITSISGTIDGACLSLDQHDIIGLTAPHDIKQGTINFKHLKADFVCINCLDFINHISYTSVCEQAEGCK